MDILSRLAARALGVTSPSSIRPLLAPRFAVDAMPTAWDAAATAAADADRAVRSSQLDATSGVGADANRTEGAGTRINGDTRGPRDDELARLRGLAEASEAAAARAESAARAGATQLDDIAAATRAALTDRDHARNAQHAASASAAAASVPALASDPTAAVTSASAAALAATSALASESAASSATAASGSAAAAAVSASAAADRRRTTEDVASFARRDAGLPPHDQQALAAAAALARRGRRDGIGAADPAAQAERPLQVEITIGRIEVRQPPSTASPSNAPGAAAATAGARARMTLAEYLAKTPTRGMP